MKQTEIILNSTTAESINPTLRLAGPLLNDIALIINEVVAGKYRKNGIIDPLKIEV